VLEDRCVPTTWTVTKVSDTGLFDDGSLHGELKAAQSGDTINFAPGLHGAIIGLNGTVFITKDLTIDGTGSGITVNGGGQQVFDIAPGVHAHINGLTITGGNAPFPTFLGGGIYNQGFLLLANSTVTGNTAGMGTGGGAGIYNAVGATMFMSGDTVNNNSAGPYQGGGISNAGVMEIDNSTIAANTANKGGGIFNSGVLNLVNSTVASNTLLGGPVADGGGIYNIGSHLGLLNTIVFNPTSGASSSNDVYGTIDQAQGDLFGSTVTIAAGGNLGSDQVNPNVLLGPLQNNGGPTATMALLPGSPGIGGGVSTSLIPGLTVPTTDQRGDPRPANSTDIGAFQTQPPQPQPQPQPMPGPVPDVTPQVSVVRGKLRHRGGRYRQTITLHNNGAALAGPLYLVVDQLTRKVRLQKPTGLTHRDAPLGDPYVLVSPAGQVFGSGQTRTVVLTFGNPLGRKVRYNLRVLDGTGTP
jgi:hypothetical protein